MKLKAGSLHSVPHGKGWPHGGHCEVQRASVLAEKPMYRPSDQD